MGYLTQRERQRIEDYLQCGLKPKEIADRLGRHYTTIYREIKRGTVLLRDGRTWLDVPTYCSDVGQRKQDEKSHNKGVCYKVGNLEYLDRAAYYIKEKHYSPYACLVALRQEFPDISICKTTFYNYIDRDMFLNVTRDDLPYKKHHESAQEAQRSHFHRRGAKSIEERPKAVNKRNLYGDWEMDTVHGGQGKGSSCLLVFTERYTRESIIRKMPDRKTESVIKEIDTLEQEYGRKKFCEIFRTVTCDNGMEFADFQGIEKSSMGTGKRTELYFCHPFCSSERGSNENENKLIRRFIRKGESIDDYSEDFIRYIQDWINDYPRKLFDGLSTNQFKMLESIS